MDCIQLSITTPSLLTFSYKNNAINLHKYRTIVVIYSDDRAMTSTLYRCFMSVVRPPTSWEHAVLSEGGHVVYAVRWQGVMVDMNRLLTPCSPMSINNVASEPVMAAGQNSQSVPFGLKLGHTQNGVFCGNVYNSKSDDASLSYTVLDDSTISWHGDTRLIGCRPYRLQRAPRSLCRRTVSLRYDTIRYAVFFKCAFKNWRVVSKRSLLHDIKN